MAKVIWIDFTPDETLEEASAYWEECMATIEREAMSQRICNSKSEPYWNKPDFKAHRMTFEDLHNTWPNMYRKTVKADVLRAAKRRRLLKTTLRKNQFRPKRRAVKNVYRIRSKQTT